MQYEGIIFDSVHYDCTVQTLITDKSIIAATVYKDSTAAII